MKLISQLLIALSLALLGCAHGSTLVGVQGRPVWPSLTGIQSELSKRNFQLIDNIPMVIPIKNGDSIVYKHISLENEFYLSKTEISVNEYRVFLQS